MGICKTYILVDEFDWNYVSSKKQDQIEKIKSLGYNVIASWYSVIVIDAGKKMIEYDDRFDVPFDALYVQRDHSLTGIHEVKMPKK